VFIDETGASTKMARRYGRAPCGERCRAPVPHGHWRTTTFVGALLTGVFAAEAIGGKAGLLEGNVAQLSAQAVGVGATLAYGAVASFLILKAIDLAIGLRVDEEVERDGLDLALHGETVA